MFSTARSVAAGSASPVRQVLEFAHAHPHLVGLGLLIPPPSSSLAGLVDIPGDISIRNICSQPMRHRPSLARVHSPRAAPAKPLRIPHAPHLRCSVVLPPVFSPPIGSPSSVNLPLAEGYFSDDENTEQTADVTQPMVIHGATPHHFASTTNSSRSNLRNPRLNARLTTQEVDRVGLGISRLTLSSLNPNHGTLNDRRSEFSAADVPNGPPIKTAHFHPVKTVGFITNAQIIGSPVEDGYAADTEHEDLVGSRRYQSYRSGSVSSGPSFRSRQKTPFYAPNKESSWLQ